MPTGIEATLYIDPQTVPSKPCPVCGGATYPPEYFCLRCEVNNYDANADQ